MRKTILISLLLAALIVTLWWLQPAGEESSSHPLSGLPWQIEILSEGTSKVFGLTLAKSTIADARDRFGPDMELALIAAPGETGALEAYFSSVTMGIFSGKLVLTAALDKETVEGLRQRARKSEYMDSSTRKYILGLDDLAVSWLITPPWNTIVMLIAYTWLSTGTNMILFLVGLQNIPTDPIEAAKIDGANTRQLNWYVIFPLLRPVTTVVVTIAVVNGFKVFDLIWVMTQGGPYRSSETLAVTMYRESFVSFRLGYGAAIATILSFIVIMFSIIYLRSIFKREE